MTRYHYLCQSPSFLPHLRNRPKDRQRSEAPELLLHPFRQMLLLHLHLRMIFQRAIPLSNPSVNNLIIGLALFGRQHMNRPSNQFDNNCKHQSVYQSDQPSFSASAPASASISVSAEAFVIVLYRKYHIMRFWEGRARVFAQRPIKFYLVVSLASHPAASGRAIQILTLLSVAFCHACMGGGRSFPRNPCM